MSADPPSTRKRFLAIGIIATACAVLIILVGISLYLGSRESKSGESGSGIAGARDWSAALDGLHLADRGRRFLTSQCTDLQSNLWVGSEDSGVWRFDPTAPSGAQWKQFSVSDGLGDEDVTALACDRKGRVWAGQGRSGVSVWNGATWQNYGVTAKSSGPVGEHVFCIEVCPLDGDVWIGTSGGIMRYSESGDRWISYTRAQGLPSDEPAAISFNAAGDAFVATQCDGLAIGRAAENYAHWQHIDGPEQFLTDPTGDGLPSNRLNDVLAADNNQVYVASPEGMGWSSDGGAHWRYVKGNDWAAKMQSRATMQATQQPLDPTASPAFLPEDYLTSLSLNSKKEVIAACRDAGLVKVTQHGGDLELEGEISAGEMGRLPHHSEEYQAYPRYGGGLEIEGGSHPKVDLAASSMAPAPLPTPAAAPDLTTLNGELVEISRVPSLQASAQSVVETLPDDWATRGDWLGRYGRFQCAIAAIVTGDYRWGGSPDRLQYAVMNGPHEKEGDSNRYWIATLYNTDPRTLELPSVYMHSRVLRKLTTWAKNRRQAEWNDNGETYPTDWEGPDLYVNVDVPEGVFNMSFYEINDDGHGVRESRRDLELMVKARGDEEMGESFTGANFDAAPTLARSRVVNFYAGVYKKFLVQGPAKLTVKLCRNYSPSCGIMSALMLDLVDPRPEPFYSTPAEWSQASAARKARNNAFASGVQSWPASCSACDSTRDAVVKILAKLDDLRDWNPQWLAINQRRIAVGLARWCLDPSNSGETDHASTERNAAIFYAAGSFPQYEDAQTATGDTTVRATEKAFRWDGKFNSSGHEYDVLTHNAAALKATEDRPATSRPVRAMN